MKRIYFHIITMVICVFAPIHCNCQNLIDNYHEIPNGWKKTRVGSTRIFLETPSEFNPHPHKEKMIGNTISFVSESKYAMYIVSEQIAQQNSLLLLENFSSQLSERIKKTFLSAVLKSEKKFNVQGLSAIKTEFSIMDSTRKMRMVCLVIRQERTVWFIEATSFDEARPNSEVNYLLSTVEIDGAPQPKFYPAIVYTYVEKMPQLPSGGGLPMIVKAIQGNLEYPPQALQNKIEGKVFVSFVVTQDGNVTEIKLVKGVEASLDESAIAAVRKLPKFVPGEQKAKRVCVSFTVPITFRLTN